MLAARHSNERVFVAFAACAESDTKVNKKSEKTVPPAWPQALNKKNVVLIKTQRTSKKCVTSTWFDRITKIIIIARISTKLAPPTSFPFSCEPAFRKNEGSTKTNDCAFFLFQDGRVRAPFVSSHSGNLLRWLVRSRFANLFSKGFYCSTTKTSW